MQTRNVLESAAVLATVGGVLVGPTMDDATSKLRFAITGGNTAGVFGIDAATGQLFIASRTNLNLEGTRRAAAWPWR